MAMTPSSSVAESHTFQELRAERLQQLTVYVGEPHCFLVCRSCCIVLPLSLVYDALVMQPLYHLNKAIAHPALKLRACNANQVLILSCYSLAWQYPLNLPAFGLA
jgi:hypothetical protein